MRPRFCGDNRTKATESSFESPSRFVIPMRRQFDAELSKFTIHNRKHTFMGSHPTQVFPIVLSDNMPRRLIEGLGATSEFEKGADSAAQMISDFLVVKNTLTLGRPNDTK
jgi:hypothetical protein